MQCDAAADRLHEGLAIGRRELETGRDAGRYRRLVGIDHRVGEPASAGDYGHAAIAQPIELCKPARSVELGRESR